MSVAMILWAMALPCRAEIVYDNTSTYLGRNYGAPVEFGDEINLAGTARLLNKFAFEYYGGFQPNGTQTARIRFYLNDGPLYKKYPTPGTVFYDSGSFELATNYVSKYLDLPYIEAPTMFTWTITFEGLSQMPGDEAGLLVYSPPSVGAPLAGGRIGSYNDYWKRKADSWALYTFGDGVPANFSARFTAVEEQVRIVPFTYPDGKSLALRWRGKQGSTFFVQQSPGVVAQWGTVGAAEPDAEAIVSYVLPLENDPEGLVSVYRAIRLGTTNEPARLVMSQDSRDGIRYLDYAGNPGGCYEFQISDVQGEWITVTNFYADLVTGAFSCEDREAGTHPSRQYRSVRPTSGSLLPLVTIEPVGGGCVLRWKGFPGSLGMIQHSTNLVHWHLVATAKADAQGNASLTMTNSMPGALFYRLLQP